MPKERQSRVTDYFAIRKNDNKKIKVAREEVHVAKKTPKKAKTPAIKSQKGRNGSVSKTSTKSLKSGTKKTEARNECSGETEEGSSIELSTPTRSRKIRVGRSVVRQLDELLAQTPPSAPCSSLPPLLPPIPDTSPAKRNLFRPRPPPILSLDAFEDSPTVGTEELGSPDNKLKFLTTEEPGLALPVHCRRLMELFRHSDHFVSMLHSRDELITFSKIKLSMQRTMKKNFETKHLGQMKTIYPMAYIFDLRKNQSIFGQRSRPDEYELIISPNLDSDLFGHSALKSPLKAAGSCTPLKSPRTPTKSVPQSPKKTPTKLSTLRQKMTSSRLRFRSKIFKHNLVQFVKEEHQKFLESLEPSVEVGVGVQWRPQRWHPEFDVNLVREIPAAHIPAAPDTQSVSTAQQLLSNTSSPLPQRLQQALSETAQETKDEVSLGSSPTKEKVKKILKGVSPALLAKIRMKDQKRKEEAMVWDPEKEERRKRLSQLPNMIRILHGCFLEEKKRCLLESVLVESVLKSWNTATSRDEVSKHLNLLAEVLPSWYLRTPVESKGVYVKLSAEQSRAQLLDAIERERRR